MPRVRREGTTKPAMVNWRFDNLIPDNHNRNLSPPLSMSLGIAHNIYYLQRETESIGKRRNGGIRFFAQMAAGSRVKGDLGLVSHA